MSRIIAVLNQKGGVGKTTTSINVSAYLAKTDKTVLLVDFDPQGNATSGLGLTSTPTDDHKTVYEVLLGTATVDECVREVLDVPGLYVLPANAQLAAAEIELVGALDREKVLKQALAHANYDYIFIDCPPALGLLTINALAVAHEVLIPVQAEYYALEGLSQLLGVIQRVRQGINPQLNLLGVVLTMYNSRTTLSEQVMQEIKKHFGDKVFHTIIPRNVRLAEAPSYGRTIFAHDKWSKGARAYKQLAKEVEKRG